MKSATSCGNPIEPASHYSRRTIGNIKAVSKYRWYRRLSLRSCQWPASTDSAFVMGELMDSLM